MTDKRRVVITGLGVATSIGIGIESFWEALIRSQCGIKPIEAFETTGFPVQVAGELPTFKLADYIPKTYRKSVKVMSRDIKVAVISAYHAVTDAGLTTKCLIERGEAEGSATLKSQRFGANIGAGLICADLPELADALSTALDDQGNFSLKKWGHEGMNNLTPLWLLKFLPNMLACHVTIVHDAQGPSNTITCGEASGHLAIGEAFRTIVRGNADVCICGGAESKMNPMAILRQHFAKRLNTNESNHGVCQPFSANRSGTAVAEGGGLVILEELEHARARGAKIYAELVGFGAGCQTQHWNHPDKNGESIALAMKKGLHDAKIEPEQIDLANPFGVATVEHDAAEMAAWNHVFGKRLSEIPAITTRGATGNNGAGSGAIDFAATVFSLHHNTVPPSIHTDNPDPVSHFHFVQGDPIDAKIDAAISVSFALCGGQSAALVIKRFQE